MKIKKIFLVHHTHLDIGYTDLPEEVLDQHLNHMDMALKLCREDKRFRWTIESAWLVRDYLEHRPDHCRTELLESLRSGAMELMGLETQPLTELLSAYELFRNVSYPVELGELHGFPVKTAMIDDIGGYTGRLPTFFSQAGIKYLVAGVGAFQVHLPWSELPHLFYLEAKDGARTLVWNLGIDRHKEPQEMERLNAVYGFGALTVVLPWLEQLFLSSDRGVEVDVKKNIEGVHSAESVFRDFADRLVRENYPYDEVLLQYGGDNRGPAAFLPELIVAINKTGKMPEIELTTPSIFFEFMVHKYGAEIPVCKGIVNDPWSMRANPAPSALKKYRSAQRKLTAAISRSAFDENRDEKMTELQKLTEDNLQLYGEHTCGLSEWGWPDLYDSGSGGGRAPAFDRFRTSWKAKALCADMALRFAEKMERLVKQRKVPEIAQGASGVLIWNDAPRKTSGITVLYAGRDSHPLEHLSGVNGERIQFQQIGHNRYLIQVESVPGFGTKLLKPVFADQPVYEYNHVVSPVPEMVETKFFQIHFDRHGDLKTLHDRKTGFCYNDTAAGFQFGSPVLQLLNDLPQGVCAAGMTICNNMEFPKPEITAAYLSWDGEIACCITQEGHFTCKARTIRFRREFIIYQDFPRVDVNLRLDKPENAGKESIYIAFPFTGLGGDLVFDQNAGWVNPQQELLTGSTHDLFLCSNYAAILNHRFSAEIFAPDAPVFQFGQISTVQWLKQKPYGKEKNHLFGQIYHNLLNTDCPVWQDVLDTFTYHIFLRGEHAGFNTINADMDSTTALSAESCFGCAGVNNRISEKLEISPETVRLHALIPSDVATTLMLENQTGDHIKSGIKFKGKTFNCDLKPFELKMVQV